jgi:hypothetical protein
MCVQPAVDQAECDATLIATCFDTFGGSATYSSSTCGDTGTQGGSCNANTQGHPSYACCTGGSLGSDCSIGGDIGFGGGPCIAEFGATVSPTGYVCCTDGTCAATAGACPGATLEPTSEPTPAPPTGEPTPSPTAAPGSCCIDCAAVGFSMCVQPAVDQAECDAALIATCFDTFGGSATYSSSTCGDTGTQGGSCNANTQGHPSYACCTGGSLGSDCSIGGDIGFGGGPCIAEFGATVSPTGYVCCTDGTCAVNAGACPGGTTSGDQAPIDAGCTNPFDTQPVDIAIADYAETLCRELSACGDGDELLCCAPDEHDAALVEECQDLGCCSVTEIQ